MVKYQIKRTNKQTNRRVRIAHELEKFIEDLCTHPSQSCYSGWMAAAAMIYCRSDYDYDLLIICMNGGCDEDDYLIVYHIAEIVIYIF